MLGSRPRRLSLVVAALVVVGVATATPAPAAPSQEAEGVRVDAVGGFDGRYLSGRRVPVTVTIRADRLVRGTVEVSFSEVEGTWSTPVEVPGGGEKDVVVVVPTPFGTPVREARVRLVGAGDAVTIDADLEALDTDELVGLLPGVTPADLPAPFAFPQELGTARFVELEPELLGLAGAIDPLGTIVAAPDEVGSLDPAARQLLLDWVDRGGRLVVDSAPGTAVAGLPDEWLPATGGHAAAGLGEVRQSSGRASAGDWANVLEPTPTVSLAELFNLGGINTVQIESVGDSVARDAGIDALDLPWLLGFLAAYVVLAGPVGYFVIRKRRPGLGWVLVPGLAVAFTGMAFVVGADLRSGNRAAHGTVLETGPGGNRATTVVGAVSRSGADGTAHFPEGWTAGGVDTTVFGFGQAGGAGELAVTTSGGRADATVPLAAGGFGVLRGSGPVPDDGGLVVEASSGDDAVTGTVRNDLPFTVEDIGLMLGRSTDRIGDLGPGEEATFEFRGDEFRLGDAFTPPEAQLWPGQAGFNGNPDLDGVVNLALLGEATNALGPNARPRGVVTAIGWTRALPSPVDVAGEASPAGRSAIIGRSPVAADVDGGDLARGAAHRELLRGPDGVDVADIDDFDSRVDGAVWRFGIPPGTGTVPLVIEIPAFVVRLEGWNGSAWVLIDDTVEDFDPNQGIDISDTHTVPLPPEVRVGDVVLVRGTLAVDFGGTDGAGLDVFASIE